MLIKVFVFFFTKTKSPPSSTKTALDARLVVVHLTVFQLGKCKVKLIPEVCLERAAILYEATNKIKTLVKKKQEAPTPAI